MRRTGTRSSEHSLLPGMTSSSATRSYKPRHLASKRFRSAYDKHRSHLGAKAKGALTYTGIPLTGADGTPLYATASVAIERFCCHDSRKAIAALAKPAVSTRRESSCA